MAGTGQCCELSCCLGGMRGTAHLVGRNLNLPEATGNGPELDGGGAIPSKAVADTLRHRRIEPARLEANSRAGHEQVPAVMYSSVRQTWMLQAELGCKADGCINAHSSCKLRVDETMELLKAGIGRPTRFQSPQGNTPGVFSEEAFSHPLDPMAPTDTILTTPRLGSIYGPSSG